LETQNKPSTVNQKTWLGRHLLLELYDCDRNSLNQVEYVEEALLQAAMAANATIIESKFHQFNPYGISGVVVIAESHLTIHTWPEHAYAAVDVFTCDDEMELYKIEEMLKKAFSAERSDHNLVQRGNRLIL